MTEVRKKISSNLIHKKSCELAKETLNNTRDDISTGLSLIEISIKYNLDLITINQIEFNKNISIGKLTTDKTKLLAKKIFSIKKEKEVNLHKFSPDHMVLYSLVKSL